MENLYGKIGLNLIFIACICASFITWYGAEGLRGTDQYWYISDVEKIMNGEELVTNTYFPGAILRTQGVPDKNYIHHNSPMLYVVAAMGDWFGAYNGWILCNLIYHFLIALSIFLISLRLTSEAAASFVTAFYLVSPIAVWQTINPLLEMYFSVLVALSLLIFFYRDKLMLLRVTLWIVLFVGVVSHPIFLAPAVVYGLVWVYDHWSENRILAIGGAIIYYIVITYLQLHKDEWFPSSFQPDLRAIIGSVVPGKSNMIWHYSDALPEIDMNFILLKIRIALLKHFFDIKFSVVYIFSNIAILMTAFLITFRTKKTLYVLIVLAIYGLQYLAMIFLQQNHPRYQQIIATVTFVIIAMAIHHFHNDRDIDSKWPVICVGVLMFMITAIAGYMAHTARQQSMSEASDIETLVQGFDVIPKGVRVVSVDLMPHNPLSYILNSRDVLFVRNNLLSREKIDRAIDLFNTDYFIIRKGGAANWINDEMVYVDSLTSRRFGEIEIYQKKI